MSSTDRQLLRWKYADAATVGYVAEPVEDAPRGRFFVVTPERHIMIFQDDVNFNRFSGCSQENIEDWDFVNVSNSASFYDLQPAAPFVAAVSAKSGILVFTTTSAYLVSYIGAPYFYSYTFMGFYNAPVSGNALTPVANAVIWYASDGFWQFDGQTITPLDCPLLDYVQQNIDIRTQMRRVQAVYIGKQSEAWFFYPEKEGTGENSAAVFYNFDEKWWSMAKIGRTCGVPGSASYFPLMSDGVRIYAHEKGRFYSNATVLPYALTAAINVAKGARRATVRQGIADTRADHDDVVFDVGATKTRIKDPTNSEDLQLTRAIRRDGGKVDFRVTGRDVYIRIRSLRDGVEPWTFGQMLVKVIPRGGR